MIATVTHLPLWLLLLALLPGLAALAILSSLRPDVLLLFGVMVAFAYPQPLLRPGGAQAALGDLLFLLALGAWTVARSGGSSNRPWLSRTNTFLVPSLVWAAVSLASTAWSDNPRQSIVFAVQMIEIVVLMTLAFASLPRFLATVRRALMAYLAAACVMAVAVLVLGRNGLPGGLGKNSSGAYLGAAVVIAVAFALTAKRASHRTFALVTSALLLAGLIATYSRGSIIGTLIAIVSVSVLLRAGRMVILYTLIATAGIFISGHGLASADRLKDNYGNFVAGSYDTSTLRTLAFEGAKRKIAERPFLGSGAGTYTDQLSEINVPINDPQNMFLLTWSELGIPGMLALFYLLSAYARIFMRCRRLPEEHRVIAVAAGGVSLSMFIHFQVDVTWTRGTTSLAFAMIGIILSMERLAKTSVVEPSPVPPMRRGPEVAVTA